MLLTHWRLRYLLPCRHRDGLQDLDPAWAETGDKYILKLFRDYVYHQVRAQCGCQGSGGLCD